MPQTITLKNAANVNVVYTKQGVSNGVHTYVAVGANQLDQGVLTLSIVRRGNTNAVVGRLLIPHVVTDPVTSMPKVALTETGSVDLRSVKAAPVAVSENFAAQFGSLINNETVQNAYVTGILD